MEKKEDLELRERSIQYDGIKKGKKKQEFNYLHKRGKKERKKAESVLESQEL